MLTSGPCPHIFSRPAAISRSKEPVMLRVSMALGLSAVLASSIPAAAADAGMPVTFTKDVAPIFQQKCEACHRPNNMAPMSLVTYEDARPWAKSIAARVGARQMPPWHIDKTIG